MNSFLSWILAVIVLAILAGIFLKENQHAVDPKSQRTQGVYIEAPQQ